MLRELLELTRIRVLLLLREPEAIFWVFVFPLVLAGVLGWAFRAGGAPPSRVGLLPDAAALAPALERSGDIAIERFDDAAAARAALVGGRVDVLVGAGSPARIEMDPQRTEAVTARLRVDLALDPDRPRPAVEEIHERGSRYVDFLVPGLLGMNLMSTGLWGIGFAIADVRRRKLLRRMLVTPMRRSSFFLSFLLSRLTFLVGEVALLVAFAVWLLGVPFRAGVGGFAAFTLLGAFTFAGMGILAASRARTVEGVSGIINFVMMPMWLCSGVFFSYERFPALVQPLIRALPLTALNDALRAMMLRGEPAAGLLPQAAVLLVWALAVFAIALCVFRWE